MSVSVAKVPLAQRTLPPPWLAVAAWSLLVVGKWAAGVQAASHALLADALVSAAQLAGILLSGTGTEPLAHPPRGLVTWQRGRTIGVAGAFAAAALGAAWYGIRLLNVPHPPPTILAAGVAGAAIVLEKAWCRQLPGAPGSGSSPAWYQPGNAFPSNLALVGISLAMLGGPGYDWADDLAALGICALLVGNAYRLLPAFSIAEPAVGPNDWQAPLQRWTLATAGIIHTEADLTPAETGSVLHVRVRVAERLTVQQEHALVHQVQAILAPVQPPSSTLLVQLIAP